MKKINMCEGVGEESENSISKTSLVMIIQLYVIFHLSSETLDDKQNTDSPHLEITVVTSYLAIKQSSH